MENMISVLVINEKNKNHAILDGVMINYQVGLTLTIENDFTKPNLIYCNEGVLVYKITNKKD